MNDKTSALIAYLGTIVQLVINMVIDCVQVVIIVHSKQKPLMLTPALLGHTLKNKEHKVGSSDRFWLQKSENFVVHVYEYHILSFLTIKQTGDRIRKVVS